MLIFPMRSLGESIIGILCMATLSANTAKRSRPPLRFSETLRARVQQAHQAVEVTMPLYLLRLPDVLSLTTFDAFPIRLSPSKGSEKPLTSVQLIKVHL